MSEGAIFMLFICAMFPALIIVAIGVKLWEIRQASQWPETTGKVVTSRVQAKRSKPGDGDYDFDDTEVENLPLVEYEFMVDGRKFRGNRVTIGEKTSEFELEEILDRYPVGAIVTVYYDPKNPQKAVLERTLPMGTLAVGAGCLLLFFVGVPTIGALLYFNALDLLKGRLVDPGRAPIVAAIGIFGLAVSVFAIAFQRMTWQASRWPVTKGVIRDASVEEFRDYRSARVGSYGRAPLRYKPSVVYTYEVNGRLYAGDRVTMGVKISSNLPGLAGKMASRYSVGSEVDVHYNPASPGESVLHPRSASHYLLWVIAGGMFILSWAIATGKL
ncbi:MAG: DUF3592 domain-containing protein [Planctomycetota bacterium]